MIKCFLLDDEQDCLDSLTYFLNKHCPESEIIGTAGSVKEALAVLPNLEVDIVFFDIQLKDGLSFEILDQLENINFQLIFVTAFDTYAIKAFKYSALDYLLKPLQPLELKAAFDRVITRKNESVARQIDLLIENINTNAFEKIAITTRDKVIYLKLDEILHCSAEGSYTEFFTSDKKRYIATGLLKEFSNILPENTFVRTHRSHVVNISQLRIVGNDYVELLDSTKVPLARRRKKVLEDLVKAS